MEFDRDNIRHKGNVVERCPKGYRKDLKTGICIPARDLKLRAQRLNKKPREVSRSQVKAESLRKALLERLSK